MHIQAPYEYIRDYYDHVHRKNAQSLEVSRFWLSSLGHIQGDTVLNIGCGPQLYDYLLHFGRAPKRCVGLDVNRSTFQFLRRSRDPRLLEAKSRVRALGTEVEFLCADVFECEERIAGQFDNVLGVGVFATFHGARFERLMSLMHRALKPGGTLLKITWHGPHRTPEQTRDKLRYGYDTTEEPTPRALVEAITRAGFELDHESILEHVPRQVGWDAVQVCVFRRPG